MGSWMDVWGLVDAVSHKSRACMMLHHHPLSALFLEHVGGDIPNIVMPTSTSSRLPNTDIFSRPDASVTTRTSRGCHLLPLFLCMSHTRVRLMHGSGHLSTEYQNSHWEGLPPSFPSPGEIKLWSALAGVLQTRECNRKSTDKMDKRTASLPAIHPAPGCTHCTCSP